MKQGVRVVWAVSLSSRVKPPTPHLYQALGLIDGKLSRLCNTFSASDPSSLSCPSSKDISMGWACGRCTAMAGRRKITPAFGRRI